MLDYLAATADTVGAAITQVARYIRLTEAPYTLDPRPDENPIRVLFDCPLDAFTMEFGIVLTVLRLQGEVESRFNILSVTFSHAPDDAAGIETARGLSHPSCLLMERIPDYPRGLGSPDAAPRPRPARRARAQAAEIAARIPEGRPITRDVGRVLASRMAEGDVSIQMVARALATSTRSLQRRLAEAGTSYQQVLDTTRRDAAGQYLCNPGLSIGEVAYLLGYSEPAAFHRAFKRWNRMTPQAFRENHGQKPAVY